MKIRNAVAFTCTIALLAAAGLAQSTTPSKPTETAKPAAQPKPEHPAAKPGDKPAAKPGEHPAKGGESEAKMAEMMKKFDLAATPGPMHAWLAKGVGTWEGACTFQMTADMPPEHSTCTTTITSFLDGRFMKGEHAGMVEMNGQKIPFFGFILSGYNNTTKKFEQTWIDSMGTMMMNSVGTLSADHKTLTYTSNYTCPATEKPISCRMVETHTGDNTMTLEMFGPDMVTGKEFRNMEIKYTRKAGTAKPEHPAVPEIKKDAKPTGK